MILKNLTTDQLASSGAILGMSPRHARQIQTLVFKHGCKAMPEAALSEISKLKWKSFVEAIQIPHLRQVEKIVSPYDGFAKYLFEGIDAQRFEAVRIPLLHRPGDEKFIVCVSTQVGCGVGCAFCATGKMGFKRNLETWEIVDQVVKISADSEHPIRGVVYMGMGEPLLNYANVINASKILSDPCGMSIDSKSITISTAGIVPNIRKYTAERHKYRLVTSLHAATNELRTKLVPLNANYPLEQIMSALRDYQASTRRRVLLAWTMISGVNMNVEQMRALKKITEGLRFTLDLIPVNDVTGQFLAPSKAEVDRFVTIIKEEVNCPIALRYSGGKDVHGACGMLAGKESSDETSSTPAPPQTYYPAALA